MNMMMMAKTKRWQRKLKQKFIGQCAIYEVITSPGGNKLNLVATGLIEKKTYAGKVPYREYTGFTSYNQSATVLQKLYRANVVIPFLQKSASGR